MPRCEACDKEASGPDCPVCGRRLVKRPALRLGAAGRATIGFTLASLLCGAAVTGASLWARELLSADVPRGPHSGDLSGTFVFFFLGPVVLWLAGIGATCGLAGLIGSASTRLWVCAGLAVAGILLCCSFVAVFF